MFKHTAHPKRLRRSQGVALIFALITLVALMLGALALVRNTDTAALVLGNQDATQSADQATREAINWLNINSAALNASKPKGYYASTQEYAADGTTKLGPIDLTGNQLPNKHTRQLIDWDDNDCSSTAGGTYASCAIEPELVADTINGNTAKYVILRMCNKVGDFTKDDTIICATPLGGSNVEISSKGLVDYKKGKINYTSAGIYFRILVRIEGLRGATSFTETIVHF
jgi:Tfp pilus assembly protein PilV